MPKIKRKSTVNHITAYFLVFLLIIGSLIRVVKLSNLDQFAGDQGLQLLTAEHIFRYNIFPADGEISALDEDSQLIVHKSVYGLYLSSLSYILSFRSVIGYFVVYSIINIFAGYLIFKTVTNIFGTTSGIISVLLFVLAPLSIEIAAWPSQPTNAINVEILSLYFFSRYWREKSQKKFLLISLVLTQLAAAIYTPYYLTFLAKFILAIKHRNKINLKLKHVLLLIVCSALIYLPTLASQLKNNWYDFRNLYTYLQSKTGIGGQADKQLMYNLPAIVRAQLENTFTVIIPKRIGRVRTSEGVLILLLIGLASAISRKTLDRQRVFAFVLFWIVSWTLLMIFNHDYTQIKAYLYILFPYTIVLFGVLFSKLNSTPLFFAGVIYFSVSLPAVLSNQLKPNNHPTASQIETVASNIYQESTKSHQRFPIYLYVVSQGDSWGWDNTPYWYYLEQMTNKQLVSIDFKSGKMLPLVSAAESRRYLICHGLSTEFTETACTTRFSEVAIRTQLKSFSLSKIQSLETISVFVIL